MIYGFLDFALWFQGIDHRSASHYLNLFPVQNFADQQTGYNYRRKKAKLISSPQFQCS